MDGYFSPDYFSDYFDADDQTGPTGFIPRGSVAGVAMPSLPSATVVVPSLPEAEVT